MYRTEQEKEIDALRTELDEALRKPIELLQRMDMLLNDRSTRTNYIPEFPKQVGEAISLLKKVRELVI